MMYSPLLFTTLVHLSTNCRKICRSNVEELVESVFEVFIAVEGNTPHLVRHGAEKIIIHWRNVWRVRGVLKNFPFELLGADLTT